MNPRPYRLGLRQVAADQTRARVVAAARDLLAADGGFADFTVDAVARAAGVARMTVYYQFGSKLGLIEALFDSLAAQGLLQRLVPAFRLSDPHAALAELIAAFGDFWTSDRLMIRRVRGLAALDPDFEKSVRDRDERRRDGLRTVLSRLAANLTRPLDEAVDVLFTLTSFETFDSLAGATRTPADVAPLVQRLARDAVGLAEVKRRPGRRKGMA